MKALDLWGAQRAYPERSIPAEGFGRALEQARTLRLRTAFGAGGGPTPWEPIGPVNVGGRTLCLALHPDDPDVIFAGSASGGLWKTTTGGVGADAWSHVDTGLPVLGVATIAIDPTDGDVMYIGTGETYAYQSADGGEVVRTTRGSYGIGILKSIDGGASWQPSLDWTYQQSRGVWAVRIDPSDTATLYAATTEGVFKSTDAGDVWMQLTSVPMAMDLAIHATDPDVVFAAHGNLGSAGVGIYRTTDGGANWTRLTVGLPPSWTGKAGLAIAPSQPDTIYASIGDTFSGRGLYRSDNRGASWTQVNAVDYPRWQGWYSHYVVVSPFDADTLVVGGIEIWRSTSGGALLDERSNWQSFYFGTSPPEGPLGDPDYAHADHHFAVWHPTLPGTIYFASDGGVFRTTDFGVTFESLIGGYQTSQFYNGFSNSATDPDFAMGGLQDNFTVIYEGNGAWRRVIGGDGTYTAQNPLVPTTVYGAAQSLQLLRSDDGGVGWTWISPPNTPGDVTAFVAPYVLSPSSPTVLYAARSRVYRSDNEGIGWTATNSGFQLSSGNPVMALAVAPSDVETVYAGTAPLNGRARVFVTRNGGASWHDVTGVLPDRYPSDFAVDPTDPERVVVTLMGFGTSHVFLSEDGGASWDDIGAGLPDIPTSAIEIDPVHRDVFYVGTDLGAWVSLDGGRRWQPFGAAMPGAMVNDLDVFAPGRLLRAATHGNGAWQRPLFDPASCSGPGPATDLRLSRAGGLTTLRWNAPVETGPAAVAYDTAWSLAPNDFGAPLLAGCVEADGYDLTSQDSVTPGPGRLRYYLIRSESFCGDAVPGSDSSGQPRIVPDCTP